MYSTFSTPHSSLITPSLSFIVTVFGGARVAQVAGSDDKDLQLAQGQGTNKVHGELNEIGLCFSVS